MERCVKVDLLASECAQIKCPLLTPNLHWMHLYPESAAVWQWSSQDSILVNVCVPTECDAACTVVRLLRKGTIETVQSSDQSKVLYSIH